MTLLPNVENAFVPERKITHYLLDETHPVGKHKAIFFMHFGFTIDEWEVLLQALRVHAATNEIAGTLQTEEGIHYRVEGPLQTPDHRRPNVRTVWAIDTDSDIPRFITAYPLDKLRS
jgi:hypothetical protein